MWLLLWTMWHPPGTIRHLPWGTWHPPGIMWHTPDAMWHPPRPYDTPPSWNHVTPSLGHMTPTWGTWHPPVSMCHPPHLMGAFWGSFSHLGLNKGNLITIEYLKCIIKCLYQLIFKFSQFLNFKLTYLLNYWRYCDFDPFMEHLITLWRLLSHFEAK